MPARKVVKAVVEETQKDIPEEKEQEVVPAKRAPAKKAVKGKPKAAPKSAPKGKPRAKAAAKKAPAKKAPVKKAAKEQSEEDDSAEDSGKRTFKLMDPVYVVDLSSLKGKDLKSKVEGMLTGDYQSRLSEVGETMDREKLPKKGGKYTGKNPLTSAKKAFRAVAKCFPSDHWDQQQLILFSVVETTKGSKNREFKYFASRIILDTPNKITRGQTSYEVKTSTFIKSANLRKGKGKVAPESEEDSEESTEESVEEESDE